MKRLIRALISCSLVFPLILSACGVAASSQRSATTTPDANQSCPATQTIKLDIDRFDVFCVQVKANQPVTFDDPPYDQATATGGGHHIICVGVNTVCDTNPDVPKDLESPGFDIMPGQQHTVTFAKPGTYDVTCTLHPMTIKVIVAS